jgi:hypothetical protein
MKYTNCVLIVRYFPLDVSATANKQYLELVQPNLLLIFIQSAKVNELVENIILIDYRKRN